METEEKSKEGASDKMKMYEMVYVIVDDGKGSKILKKARECGVSGGTVFYGKGTVSNFILNFLSLYDEKKEIVLMLIEKDRVKKFLSDLNAIFRFDKAYHGIVFTISLGQAIGIRKKLACHGEKNLMTEQAIQHAEEIRGEDMEQEKSCYEVITTIVNRGQAEDVVEAAKLAGAKGGTIINARGSGVHETMKLFHMDIEPEKEMVMILVKKDLTSTVVQSITQNLNIEEAGKGILFVQEISCVLGLYE